MTDAEGLGDEQTLLGVELGFPAVDEVPTDLSSLFLFWGLVYADHGRDVVVLASVAVEVLLVEYPAVVAVSVGLGGRDDEGVEFLRHAA